MPKRPQVQKAPPKSKKLPRKLPDDRVSRADRVSGVTEEQVGDTADKIMRAPKGKPKAR